MNMPIGMIVLLVAGVLIYFGIAQRLLDRMRLTDKQAILFIVAMVAGSFIDIPVMSAPTTVTINVGGALLPALLSIWLIAKAGLPKERIRAVASTVLVAGAVYLGSRYLPYEPETMFLDPKLIYGAAAGLIAYAAGRSRRSAFVGGVLGIILSDLVHAATLAAGGVAGTTAIGGAGVFDVVMIAGLVAVMTAELVGETREKLQGGPELGPARPQGLYEFSKELAPADRKQPSRGVPPLRVVPPAEPEEGRDDRE